MRILSWLAGILFTIGVCTTVLVFVVCDPLAEPWSVPASALVASPDAGPAQAPASRGARAGGGLPRVTRSEWLLLLGATGLLGLLATGLSRRSSGAVAKRERAPKRPASPPSAAPVRQSPGREVLAEFEASWRTFATYLQDLVTQKVVPQDASSGEDVQAVRLQVENVAKSLSELRSDMASATARVQELTDGLAARSSPPEPPRESDPPTRSYPGSEVVLRKLESDLEYVRVLFGEVGGLAAAPRSAEDPTGRAGGQLAADLDRVGREWQVRLEALRQGIQDARRRNETLLRELTRAREAEDTLQLDLVEAAAREEALRHEREDEIGFRQMTLEEQGVAAKREGEISMSLHLSEKRCAEAEARASHLSDVIRGLEEKASRAEADALERKLEIEGFRADAEAARRVADDLRQRWREATEELLSSREQARLTAAEIDELRARCDADESKFREVESEVNRLLVELDRERAAGAETRAHEISGDELRLATDRELQEARSALQREAAERERSLSESGREREARLGEERARLERELEEARSALEREAAERERLAAECARQRAALLDQTTLVEAERRSVDDVRAALEARIRGLEGDRARLEEEGESSVSEHRRLLSEVLVLEAALEGARSQKTHLESDRARLVAAIEEARRDLSTERVRADEERGRRDSELEAARSEAEALAENARTFASDLAEVRLRCEVAKKECEDLRARLAGPAAELDLVVAENAHLAASLAEARAQKESAEARLAEVADRSARLDAELEASRDGFRGLEAEREDALAALETALARAEDLDADCEKLRLELALAGEELERLTALRVAETGELRARTGGLEAELASARDRIDELSRELRDSEAARTDVETRIQETSEGSRATEAELVTLREKVEKARAEAARLEDALRHEAQRAAEERGRLDAELAARTGELAAARGEIESRARGACELGEALEGARDRVRALEGELATARGESAGAADAILELERRNRDLISAEVALEERLRAAEGEILESSARGGEDRAALEAELVTLREKVEKARAEAARLEGQRSRIQADLVDASAKLEAERVRRAELEATHRSETAVSAQVLEEALAALAAERSGTVQLEAAKGELLAELDRERAERSMTAAAATAELAMACEEAAATARRCAELEERLESVPRAPGPEVPDRAILPAPGPSDARFEDSASGDLEIRARCHELYVEALARSLPAALIVLDGRDRVVSWNQWAESLFGTAETEVVGKGFFEIESPLAKPTFRKRFAEFKGDGAIHKSRVRMRAGGRVGTWMVTQGPLAGEDGMDRGTVLLVQSAGTG